MITRESVEENIRLQAAEIFLKGVGTGFGLGFVAATIVAAAIWWVA